MELYHLELGVILYSAANLTQGTPFVNEIRSIVALESPQIQACPGAVTCIQMSCQEMQSVHTCLATVLTGYSCVYSLRARGMLHALYV